MKPTIYRNRADINQMPSRDQQFNLDNGVELTIGDTQGNALALLYTLVVNQIVEIEPNQYNTFAALAKKYEDLVDLNHYEATGEIAINDFNVDTLKADFQTMIEIINGVGIARQDILVRLIGDEMDFFTLLLIKRLNEAKAKVEIVASAGLIAALKIYENNTKAKTDRYSKHSEQYTISALKLKALTNCGLIKAKAINNIIAEHYKPKVKLLSTSVGQDGTLNIFTSAPNGMEIFPLLANAMIINLDVNRLSDPTYYQVFITCINRRFQSDIQMFYLNGVEQQLTTNSEPFSCEWPGDVNFFYSSSDIDFSYPNVHSLYNSLGQGQSEYRAVVLQPAQPNANLEPVKPTPRKLSGEEAKGFLTNLLSSRANTATEQQSGSSQPASLIVYPESDDNTADIIDMNADFTTGRSRPLLDYCKPRNVLAVAGAGALTFAYPVVVGTATVLGAALWMGAHNEDPGNRFDPLHNLTDEPNTDANCVGTNRSVSR